MKYNKEIVMLTVFMCVVRFMVCCDIKRHLGNGDARSSKRGRWSSMALPCQNNANLGKMERGRVIIMGKMEENGIRRKI